jgi:hypothetical protein
VLAVALGILTVLLIDVAVFRWANQVSAKLDENRASEDGMTLVSRVRPVPHGSV